MPTKEKLSSEKAKEKLMECSEIGIRDIRKGRSKQKSGSFMGIPFEDPAIPYLESMLGGNYEGDLSGSACYAISNLGANWSASKVIKDKTSPEYAEKTEQIKGCKKLIKDFCEHKYD